MNNTNKSAFPLERRIIDSEIRYGLTKREYFAAMAMQGLASGYWNKTLQTQIANAGADMDKAIAIAAVMMADELLKQLEQTKSTTP